MTRFFGLILVIFACISLAAVLRDRVWERAFGPELERIPLAELSLVEGEVEIVSAATGYRSIVKSGILYPGDRIATHFDSRAVLELESGYDESYSLALWPESAMTLGTKSIRGFHEIRSLRGRMRLEWNGARPVSLMAAGKRFWIRRPASGVASTAAVILWADGNSVSVEGDSSTEVELTDSRSRKPKPHLLSFGWIARIESWGGIERARVAARSISPDYGEKITNSRAVRFQWEAEGDDTVQIEIRGPITKVMPVSENAVEIKNLRRGQYRWRLMRPGASSEWFLFHID